SGYQYTSPNFKLMLDRQGFYMKRLQRRFKNQTPSEVRNQALTIHNPEYYPIPINLTIEKYWRSLKGKKTVI
ncbi:MAG: hypothetical protein GX984_02875, partial [Erysipelothrix sp.]|nr:hypothetical protein [Erysipelothrix sp.]